MSASSRPAMVKVPAKRKPKSSGFNFNWNDEDFEELQRRFVPENTTSDTQECMKFCEWVQERNEHFRSNLVPLDLLLTDDLKLLCEWLCRFCAEIRKKDGSPFPPRTIHHYLMGIQRYIHTEKKNNLNIINDSTFLP